MNSLHVICPWFVRVYKQVCPLDHLHFSSGPPLISCTYQNRIWKRAPSLPRLTGPLFGLVISSSAVQWFASLVHYICPAYKMFLVKWMRPLLIQGILKLFKLEDFIGDLACAWLINWQAVCERIFQEMKKKSCGVLMHIKFDPSP